MSRGRNKKIDKLSIPIGLIIFVSLYILLSTELIGCIICLILDSIYIIDCFSVLSIVIAIGCAVSCICYNLVLRFGGDI